MANVSRLGELNTASLTNNDVYVIVAIPASTAVQGVETGVVGLIGTGSWGPLNTPTRCASPADVRATFGVQGLAPNDLPTDANIVLQLGAVATVGVRVSDGTDSAATAALVTAASGTVTIGGTFHVGDIITVTLGGVATAYTVLTSDVNLAGIATSVTNALNLNLAFANLAYASVNGAVVTITSQIASNSTTLTSGVTGTGAAVTATASGATLANGGGSKGTFVALYTGADGANLTYDFSPGTNTTGVAPTWNVVVAWNTSAPASELFTNLPQTGLETALAAALQNGQGVSRGPSMLARFTPAGSPVTGAPVGAVVAFTGGNNGDQNLTSSQQLGTNQAVPPTGAFALAGQGTQKWGMCGNTDSATWSTQLSIAKKIGSLVVLAFPANTTTTAAISIKAATGIADFQAAFAKDYTQFLDTVNNTLRLISPMAFHLGQIASLTPEKSPGNKQIDLVINTERTLANKPYSSDEAGLLTKNGINFITNPCPGGKYFGLRHGRNSLGDTNNIAGGIEYTNMTNFLAYSFAGSFGEFIEEVQTQASDDPTRKRAFTKLATFLNNVQNVNKFIQGWNVDMSFGTDGINTPTTVQNGYMYAKVKVQYKSIVRFFLITLIGGSNVDVTVS